MTDRRSPRHVRIFLASPGDVVEERNTVRDMLQHLQRSPLVRGDFTIEVVSWDDPDAPVPMLATLTPQQAVSRAIARPSECDFTVVIVAGRMGTPLDERKPDGTPYLSGTEWEFEDARRAGKPILIYRRTTPSPTADADPEEAARQLRSVQQFFAQFTKPSGVLTGGVTTYRTVDELVPRLQTDIETLLPALRTAEEPSPQDQGWAGRVQANVRRWRFGRLLMILAPGALVTVVAWTAFSTFSTVNQNYDASPFAYIVRYALLMLGLFVPLVLFVLTWWWLGREKTRRAA